MPPKEVVRPKVEAESIDLTKNEEVATLVVKQVKRGFLIFFV